MTKRHLLLCLLAAPLVAGAKCETETLDATGACGPDCPRDAGTAGCSYGGHTYAVGAQFPAADGCNSCTCGMDGQAACTLLGCVPADAASSPGCLYGEKHYELGASFPSLDGCNGCTCTAEGVACTARACLEHDAGAAPVCQYGGQGYALGADFPALDGCNTCTCGEGGVVGCTKKGCPAQDGGAAPDRGVGRVCDVGATAGPTEGLWNLAAPECPSGLCIKPAVSAAAAVDTAPLCTVACSIDSDCLGAAMRTPGVAGDRRCRSGFRCGVAFEIGALPCQKVCLCSDFLPDGVLTSPASCAPTP